ncbi:N-acetylmuramoyl-L-alanine amidase family protein [Sulfurovum sp. NBC37-1]|uniref:N-acetylmuramoyl-L-alanine amidase family protein n=1 Tax=Sulfurovum sp. (strain NBC37-1) TaxID=387093 RepID=UPI00015879A3|nr:N-acetylmuramoyl-L-alanine amidase [Sulfurovum sp. NBC37-1]BAF72688.1 N-acetylmuramoyl-L-alanine amidase [Sulfurovum sp. NBC37-1]
MQYLKYFLLGMAVMLTVTGCVGPDRSDDLVVIDAGHGGHDCGALCNGKQEKDLVLQITKKLAKEFKRKGYRVYLTRGKDKFLKLGERTRIADKMDAKVFISIHANAIADKSRFEAVEGIETYFLQKTRDARSQRIAARENTAVLQGADALSKDVIIDSVLNGPKIVESNKLAIDVQNGIMRRVQSRYKDARNGGAKPAPFYVLVGASRPSILVEVGYITNSKERKRLFTSDYQERIAEGIVEGVSRYLDNRKVDIGV